MPVAPVAPVVPVAPLKAMEKLKVLLMVMSEPTCTGMVIVPPAATVAASEKVSVGDVTSESFVTVTPDGAVTSESVTDAATTLPPSMAVIFAVVVCAVPSVEVEPTKVCASLSRMTEYASVTSTMVA